jgi:AcrR family transcriptional regulator
MARSTARPRLSADDWLAGGLQLLAAEGLAAVKVEPLAARLGVTKGSFYWHFEDLPSFLDAMAERWSTLRDQEVARFPDRAPAAPLDRLRFLMETISDPDTWALERAVRAWAYSNERLHERIAALDDWAYQEVRGCFEQLGFSRTQAEVRAKTLYYAGIGFLHTGSLGEPERPDHRRGLLELLTARR